MYKVGEKIVYPMHGAGTIVSIEEKEILGDIKKYYIVRLPDSEIKLMVPIDSADSVGVREIVDKNLLNDIFDKIGNTPEDIDVNWNKRYREHLQKMKTGDLVQVGTVVKNLLKREQTRADRFKKMLNNALQIIVSEISLIENKPSSIVQNELIENLLK